jgi:phosphatidylglycerophosphate synthase
MQAIAAAQEEGLTKFGKQDGRSPSCSQDQSLKELRSADTAAAPSGSPKDLVIVGLPHWQNLKPIHKKTLVLLSVCLAMACLEYALASKGDPTVTNARLLGFQNTWWTSSLVLCPSNMEYRIADQLVPLFFKLGFTPNAVVALNCCFRACCLRCLAVYRYGMVLLLLSVIQWLDAVDGHLARTHGMTSKFGAEFDHGTDNIFTVVFMLMVLYLLARQNGIRSKAVITISAIFLMMGLLGPQYEMAIENRVPYGECNIFAVLGMYQCLHMLYIEWFLTIFLSYLTEWLPKRNVE